MKHLNVRNEEKEKDINKRQEEGEHIFTTLSLCDFLFKRVCAQMLKFWKNVCAIARAWKCLCESPTNILLPVRVTEMWHFWAK